MGKVGELSVGGVGWEVLELIVWYCMGYVISRVCGPTIGSQALSGTVWKREQRKNHTGRML